MRLACSDGVAPRKRSRSRERKKKFISFSDSGVSKIVRPPRQQSHRTKKKDRKKRGGGGREREVRQSKSVKQESSEWIL